MERTYLLELRSPVMTGCAVVMGSKSVESEGEDLIDNCNVSNTNQYLSLSLTVFSYGWSE